MPIYTSSTAEQKQQQFIALSNIKHNNKYDYSLVEYKNNYSKVSIICPDHGIFEQRPDSHTNSGSGCPKCAYARKQPTTQEFVKRCVETHGNKYDYSLVEYVNSSTNITIICPQHGQFNQIANVHKGGAGCPKCAHKRIAGRTPMTTAEFVYKCQLIHKDRYDYSMTEYKHCHKLVDVCCPKHGIFQIRASSHLEGGKCKRCKATKGEQRVQNTLVNLGINFIKEHTFPDCIYVKPLRFDFYLPQHNMCIEYDGELHFKPRNSLCAQSIKDLEQSKIRDNIKDSYCLQNNIKLLRISFHKMEQIDSIIRDAVGC